MKLAVGILGHNQLVNKRAGLFTDCLNSVRAANPDVLVVADNGSNDGTAERLAELPEFVGFPRIPGFPPGNTCGYGMNKLAFLLEEQADIVVLSNDDIVWKPDAFDVLKEVWSEPVGSLTILSGLLEPTFAIPGKRPWNEPIKTVEHADHKILLRRSVPGGAWSYQSADTHLIFPVSTFPGVDDVPACHKLVENGFAVGCLDLAENAGVDSSTWGNASHSKFVVQPVNQVRDEHGLDSHHPA